ncbi:hypothetical protein OBBRIDRAFT_883536 [Obba rivulosa]|uniref:Uncharacterized protein n=1 Tax=Obba rivulosa TaxID=1052685 RepID=A0A8E2J6T9_9APHY|nr:hypothetical protein OBBRIDRAFT_883536 [Obba rivulosa]
MSASSGHHRSRSMNSGLDVTSPSSGSKGRRSMKSSDEFVIQVEPPSGAGSTYQSPTERMHAGLLSPDTAAHALPPQHMQPSEPLVPTVPNSPRSGGNMPSMGSITSVSDLPWNFIPAGQPVQTFTVPPQRVQSVGPGGSRAIDVPPTHTPSIVSPSAVRATGLPSSRPHTPYATAPTPPGLQYPSPLRMGGALPQTGTRTPGSIMAELPPSLSRTMSPRSTSSRLSGHQRSLSMNAGSTPAAMSRTLAAEAPAPAPALRRIPSTGSIASNESRHSSNYARYESREFVDPAFLASSEDLGVQSPNTMANTRANAVPRMVPGPRAPSRSSSRMSYMSGRSRE